MTRKGIEPNLNDSYDFVPEILSKKNNKLTFFSKGKT